MTQQDPVHVLQVGLALSTAEAVDVALLLVLVLVVAPGDGDRTMLVETRILTWRILIVIVLIRFLVSYVLCGVRHVVCGFFVVRLVCVFPIHMLWRERLIVGVRSSLRLAVKARFVGVVGGSPDLVTSSLFGS